MSGQLAAAPVAVRLLEADLVLWRDGAGVAHAWRDQCPHRGAQLSLGQVIDGALECRYHGWRFGSSGQCLKVPALPDFIPPQGLCTQAYGVCEAHGLVWVCLRDKPATLPVWEAEADARLRKLNCGPYEVATSAPRIVENFLDMAHFGFVHEGWLGTRTATAVESYRVERTATGILATGCKAWQPQSSVHATAPAQVEYGYAVLAPYTAALAKVPDVASVALDGYRESIALFICPVEPALSRVWFRLAVADFDSPDEKLRSFQDTIFLQDKPVLESQRPVLLPLAENSERHTVADKASLAYRSYLKELGICFGVTP